VVAFFIATIEILALLSGELHLHGPLWDFTANFDINTAGFTIAAVFVLVWLAAIGYWRLAHVEERWTPATGHVHSSFTECELITPWTVNRDEAQ
jgi:high-affinity nickel-transport protein